MFVENRKSPKLGGYIGNVRKKNYEQQWNTADRPKTGRHESNPNQMEIQKMFYYTVDRCALESFIISLDFDASFNPEALAHVQRKLVVRTLSITQNTNRLIQQ